MFVSPEQSDFAQFDDGRSKLIEIVSPNILDTLVANEDVPGTIEAMDAVREIFPEAGLEQLTEFARIYLQLTTRVWAAINNRDPDGIKFEHPDVVRHTVPIFARLFLKQLYAYGTDDSEYTVDSAWEPLIFDERVKRAEPGVQFLTGMFAHIEADLAQALYLSGVTQEYFEDYRKVIAILIDEVAHANIGGYVFGPRLIGRLGVKAVTNRIVIKRDTAWDDSLRLVDARDDIAKIIEILEDMERRSLRSTQGALMGNVFLRAYNGTITKSGLWAPVDSI